MSVWLGRQREKEVMRLCVTHVEEILNTVDQMRQVIFFFCDEDVEGAQNAFRQVFDSERQADEIKRKILEELSKGPFHPMDREDIMRLVLTVDDVGANAKSAARKINFSSPSDLNDDIKIGLRQLGNMVVQIVDKMKRAMETLLENPKEAAKLTDDLERLEEKIDDHRVELLVKIVKIGDKTEKFSSWIMLKEAVDNMENVADRSEDVADVIRLITISRS